jgi:hypothetical protein
MSCIRLALFVLGFCTAVLFINTASPAGPQRGLTTLPVINHATGAHTGP